MYWLIWVSIALLLFGIYVYTRQQEGYAPPRDENTMPPFTENTGNEYATSNNSPYVEPTGNTVTDNQTQIYKDMGGLDFQLQASNPILNFIQGDPSSNVIYGDFVPNESDGGLATMYPIMDTVEELPPIPLAPKSSPDNGQYLPELTSSTIPLLGSTLSASELPASETSQEEVPQKTPETQG